MDAIQSATAGNSGISLLREAAEQKRLQQEQAVQQQVQQKASEPLTAEAVAATAPAPRSNPAVSSTEQALQAQLIDAKRVNPQGRERPPRPAEQTQNNRPPPGAGRPKPENAEAPTFRTDNRQPDKQAQSVAPKAEAVTSAAQQAVTKYQSSQSLLQDTSNNRMVNTAA